MGNLGNEVDDNSLIRAFQAYPSFQRAKVKSCAASCTLHTCHTARTGHIRQEAAQDARLRLRLLPQRRVLQQGAQGNAGQSLSPLLPTAPSTPPLIVCRVQGKYIGNRPITIRKSEYQERSLGAGAKRKRD